jgi:hypothetical protein
MIKATKAAPSYELVSSLLSYDPESGKLFWKTRPTSLFPNKRIANAWNSRFSGKEAFFTTGAGNLKGRIFGRSFCAHRVAWLLHYGRWPSELIDHIDGNPENNKIGNLRDVSQSVNMRNMSVRSDSRSGVLGVRMTRSGTWIARITAEGVNKTLGHFADFDQAVAVRKQAEKALGFNENHGRKAERCAR